MLLFENRIAAYLMYVRNGSAEKQHLQPKRQELSGFLLNAGGELLNLRRHLADQVNHILLFVRG